MSDTQAAEQMQEAKRKLFASFQREPRMKSAASRLPLVGPGMTAPFGSQKTTNLL